MPGKLRKLSLIGILIILVLIAGVATFAIAAAITMPSIRVDEESFIIEADDLKPPECNGITLTNIVDVGAGETGTPANDLILGTDKADTEIRGGAGDDCILGGKGNERQRIGTSWAPGLYGEDGDDVLIGGPGNNDYCDGGPGADLYYSCETTY